jgi:16S rRNA (cytosine967-C5)-methyltransferase
VEQLEHDVPAAAAVQAEGRGALSGPAAADTPAVDARAIAARVLSRVVHGDAWAAALLDAEIASRPQLAPRDRALATELVYGTLRRFAWLEERALAHTRDRRFPDKVTRVEVVLAAYQLLCLERVPPHAAVDAAVRAVTRARGKRLGGFVNAVLRKLAAEGRAPEAAARGVRAPAWLEASLAAALGEDGASAMWAASAERAPIAVRCADPAAREEWVGRLASALGEENVRRGLVSDLAIVLAPSGPLTALPGFGAAFSPQDEGSQAVALAVGARAGEVVLDACAGRGHKTAILARSVLPGGAVDAVDLHDKKLARARDELALAGLSVRRAVAADLSVGPGDLSELYDRVLVDAPCTGIGTLRRRPEILLRRRPEDLVALPALQAKILATALDRVKPGGRAFYAVCSVLREEAEDVVARVLAARPDFEAAPFDSAIGERLSGGGSSLRLLPHVHGTDGYFVASLRRAR